MKSKPSDSTSAGPQLHRRGFLQAAGFNLAAAATGCHRPALHTSRPYLEAPEHAVPGRPLHYASVCDGCAAGCGTLVKVRDGRPIKLEGLDQHPGSRGGLCAMGQASLLGLYDSLRLRGPQLAGHDATWADVDEVIRSGLADVRSAGRAVRLLTPTLTSPTERAAVRLFLEAHGAVHVVHDPLSASAILDAHEATHGQRLLPRYFFDRADVIIAFDADFLGTWISPVEFTAGYRAGRRPDDSAPRMSHHVQLESTLSLSGCNADRRLVLGPEEMSPAVAALARAIAPDAVGEAGTLRADLEDAMERLADQLQRLADQDGRSLVVSGSDDVQAQILINVINHRLGNYGHSLDVERPSFQRQGNDSDFARLLAELRDGEVGALFVAGLDPLHEFEGSGLESAFERVDLLVSLSPRLDATAAAADVVCPTHHFLESWGDAEPVDGWLAVRQPTLAPLFDTRSLRAGLDAWSAKDGELAQADALAADLAVDLAAVQAHWRQEVHPRDPRGLDFQSFWDRAVHDGFVELPPASPAADRVPDTRIDLVPDTRSLAPDSFSLVLYPKVGMGDGRHADNPWLHELPDPISKVTWGNYACLSPLAARRLGVTRGDIVRLQAGGTGIELPALVQPGQHDSVVAVAMGYGDRRSERFRDVGPPWIGARPSTGDDGRVGTNGARLLDGPGRLRRGITVDATGHRRELATTQHWDSQQLPEALSPSGHGERHFVEEVDFDALTNGNHASAVHPQAHAAAGHSAAGKTVELYPDDHSPPDNAARPARKWGMTIDLDACTGCSACVVACQAENNLPVVGYDEVRRHRDMHWLRLDRYYDMPGEASEDSFDVVFQPMLCQHCDQAPCESVCPVLATVQTEEGLNAQAYNRCVGTRYCANNCPFKVRRFNWFDYRRDDPVANLVLNPDVVVRTRGVMEKCSFCVQRIENAKIESRRRGEPRVRDDEVRPACQQTCPADAIVFGDVLDPGSRVAQQRRSPRSYRLLDELNVQPSVDYLRRVRRKTPGIAEGNPAPAEMDETSRRADREPNHG